jgi:hypothetical protein
MRRLWNFEGSDGCLWESTAADHGRRHRHSTSGRAVPLLTVPSELALPEESRMPRLQPRPQRTWRNRDERPLFATDCQRAARVVVDPRLLAESLPRPLKFILDNHQVEVGTVGYSPTCDVEIHSPLPEVDAVPLSRGSRQFAIRQYDHLKQFAAARAALYRVDAESLREGIVFTEAAAVWDADFFISDSKELQTRAGEYTRELHVLTVDGAVPLLGLLLHSRGECIVPHGVTPGGWELLSRWWFYRIRGWALLPEAHVWQQQWPADKRVNSIPDWAGLNLYADPPIDGLISRIGHALRARDRVLSGMLGLEGNESHDIVLYETESLMLQLASTLDLLTKIIGQQFSVDLSIKEFAWTNRKFRAAPRRAWPEDPEEELSFVRTAAQLLALVRNRIHAAPPAPVSGEDKVWFALASEDQAEFQSLAQHVGGAAAWGVVEHEGLQGRLIDPWNLAEQATLATHHALRTVARLSVARFLSTTVQPQLSPGDPYTTEVALLYLGLQRAEDE